MYKTLDIYFYRSFAGTIQSGVIMNRKTYAISEAVGCAVIYLTAVFLHFAYTVSGGSALGILFGAVNESVWEHVKIFSAAYAGYAILQLLWIRVPFRQYTVGKCIGLYVLMGAIIGFYYAYTALFGEAGPAVYPVASLIIVILIQLLTYRLTVSERDLSEYFAPAVMLIMLYYIMFFSFTIFPPRLELFRDPTSGTWGVVRNLVDTEENVSTFSATNFAFIPTGK